MLENISKYSKLSKSEIEKISKDHLEEMDFVIGEFQREVESLEDLFVENPKIGISLSNVCDKGCSHCIADSTLNGGVMDFESLNKSPEKFLSIFSQADYGRTGDPMLYQSGNKDLADVISFLVNYGIKKHTIASGLFVHKEMNELIEKIRKIRNHNGLNIETLLTFHLYYPSFDNDLAKVFGKSVRKLAKISDKITLAVIGDTYFPETSLVKALDAFSDRFDTIFDGFDSCQKIGDNCYSVNGKDGGVKVDIVTNPAIHPYGRFEKYLKQKGVYRDYVDNFRFGNKPVLCPDAGRWPGMIVEYDGDINMCGAFEAVVSKETVVGNLFGKTYEELEKLLLDFYGKEKNWFIKNLDDLLLGKKSSCKVCNKCYEQRNS